MLNINFKKKKFNKLLLSINRLIESFFNNISDYIKEFKKKNSRFEKTNKIIFISLSSLFILVIGYFLLPTIYDKNLVKINLQNQIKKKYNLKVNFEDDISYALFPKPHFYANNLNIFQDDNVLINSKNTRIYISIKNFFSFNALKVKNILFKDNEFNIKKQNLSFFTNILNSNNSDNTIIFEDSIIFYKDISEDVIFLVDLNDLKFFFDLEKKYQLMANYKIFNLPFKLNLNHNKDKNFFSFSLESKNIRLKIKNFFQYSNKNFNGNLEAQILNDIKYFIYDIKNNSLSINSKDNNFKGEIDLRPFYLSLNLNFNEFDVKNFLKENSIFLNLINSEILNNPNINGEIDINLNKIKNFKYMEKIKIKNILEEGDIYFKNINTNWNNSVLIEINDTQLLNEDNKVNLIGSINFDFIDLDKFYRYYQINEKYRNEIKKIKFDFFLNVNEKILQINNAKIDNIDNDQINDFLDNLNSQRKNFFNRVIFRNFVKNFFEFYQEG
ncbi:MAG: hypothetical protein CBD61_02355 [Pelagibacteraceae bacterium TMED201]|nr:MAG: hypothetical protein CBD61_02355 [Pelagibacteraceae bacterium TMED201]